MAAQLADQWLQIASGTSRSVVWVHRQALDSYLKYVDSKTFTSASLDRKPAQVVEALYEWCKQLPAQYTPGSIMPYRLANIVQTQITAAIADGIVTDGLLTAVAQGPSLIAKPSQSPLEEFSKAELNQLVLAARAHVRATRRIRQWAVSTVTAYEAGELGKSHELREVARMLKLASELKLTPETAVLDTDRLSLHFPAEASLLYPRSGPSDWRGIAARWCYRAVLPVHADLTAFRILLLAGTGASPDEVGALKLSDIEWSDEGVRLQMIKARAGRSRGRFFAGQERHAGWSVPAIMDALLEFTEAARALAPAGVKEKVWVAVWRRDTQRRPYLPGNASSAPIAAGLGYWIEMIQPLYDTGDISAPHDLRRIRKTRVSQRAIELRGVMADIAADEHTTQVFFSSYAHTTTLKVYSASVMSRFQSTLAEAVRTGFTAFAQQRTKVPLAALTEALPVQETQARDLKSGALDMGVADCQDPYNSPFTQKGKLCASAPLSCFLCENAVVFTDHLPNILALIESMESARKSMGPQEWIATWGSQYDAARALVAALPDNVVHKARGRRPFGSTDLPVWMQEAP
ncbi:site-specific integrase [Mycobacteroides abscessus]|uniref:site-specific integrase n=1 Tax=Mycobacteroides abscessus TaxID=36809 RepID=UPI001055D427|nr:site-specific integrase [Mycobacteroides abscessus]